jgi:hypothetical protein
MRFSLRHLLIFTTLCGVLCAGYVRSRNLEARAEEHLRQAQIVAETRGRLLTYSFDVPQYAWDDYARQESLHRQIAAEFREQIWRPWVKITQPEKPLPMLVDGWGNES